MTRYQKYAKVVCALFLYNYTPHNFVEHLAQCLHAYECRVGLIHLLHG